MYNPLVNFLLIYFLHVEDRTFYSRMPIRKGIKKFAPASHYTCRGELLVLFNYALDAP